MACRLNGAGHSVGSLFCFVIPTEDIGIISIIFKSGSLVPGLGQLLAGVLNYRNCSGGFKKDSISLYALKDLDVPKFSISSSSSAGLTLLAGRRKDKTQTRAPCQERAMVEAEAPTPSFSPG